MADLTLTEHWNGKKWHIVSSPNAGSVSNQLRGVTHIPGTSHAWAIGFSESGSGSAQTLTEEWNGMSWKIVSSPSVGSFLNTLNGVAKVSSTRVWAVGYSNSTNYQTLTEFYCQY